MSGPGGSYIRRGPDSIDIVNGDVVLDSLPMEEAGRYEILVNGVVVDSFIVEEPADR